MSLSTTHDGATSGATSATTQAGARGPVSRWAREVAGPAVEPTAPTPPVAHDGVRGLAAAMVAGPLAMTAWFLVEPAVLPREEPAVFLGSVAAAPERYLLATAFVALAGALAVPAALGVGRLLRPRMPRLAALLVVVMSLSGLGLWAQVGFRCFVVSMVRDGSVPASAVESFTAFQQNGLFDVLLLPALALGALSTLAWVGALVRTRLAPLWVPAALLVGAVLASGEFPDAVTVGGAAVVAAGNVALARVLLRSARA
jgi:hypothetical protein